MAPRISKRTWYWIGAAALVAALIWLLWRAKEGFQNVSDQGTSFVVQAPLATLTTEAALKAIGTLQSGSYEEKFAPVTIEDYKGAEVWKAGQAAGTEMTAAQYRLVFPNTVNFSKFSPAGKLPAGINYIGQDFTSMFIIVKGDPGNLIDPLHTGNADNNYRGTYSSLGTGRTNSNYAVSKITNQAGIVYFDKNAPMTTNFYSMTFNSNVDLKRIQDYIAKAKRGGIDTGNADPVIAAENRALNDSKWNLLTLKGVSESDTTTDFTGVQNKTIVVQGPLHAVLAPTTREFTKYFSETGALAAATEAKAAEDLRGGASGGFSTETTGKLATEQAALDSAKRAVAAYLPITITTTANDTLWKKETPPFQALLKVEFIAAVNLRLAKEMLPKKISLDPISASLCDSNNRELATQGKPPQQCYGARYVGLLFTDTPPALETAGAGSKAQLGTVDYTTIYTPYAPPSQFPKPFLESGESAGTSETPASADFTASPTYVDPRAQSTTNLATGTGDYSRYVSTATPLTNRFKIRGQWSTISRPGVIATFGIAAGKTADGTYPKVVEILDYKNQKVWPTGNYVDTGLSELFTIGYDTMVDPKMGLETYISTYMPSVTYVNPAMPRVDA
jgi:hypothetical protein